MTVSWLNQVMKKFNNERIVYYKVWKNKEAFIWGMNFCVTFDFKDEKQISEN